MRARDGFGLVAAAIAFVAATGFTTAKAAHATERPNIVVILADDMGQGDLGCYNPASKAPTPHMDRLAAGGMRFTDAHSPSAVCTPTRYGLLTGRYSWRTRLGSGVLWGYSRALIEPGRLTVASMLKQHGYHTGCVGKWHLGLGSYDTSKPNLKTDYADRLDAGPLTAGFDYFYGIPASLDMEPYVWVHNDRAVAQPTEHDPGSKRRWDGGGGFWRAGPIAPGFRHDQVLPTIADKAVRYIDERASIDRQEPFFLYVALTAPHTPWVPTESYHGKSKAGWYGDFVVQCDDVVGRIDAALQRSGLADRTLVIVTSDNGSHWRPRDIAEYGHEANNGLRGMKADIHEGGHRVSFIARWPGRVPAGSVSVQLLCLTDLLATTAAIVGHTLPADAGEDSVNMLPALLDQAGDKPLREAIVHHSVNGLFAIRQGKWKLVQGLGSGGFTAPATVEPKENGPRGQLFDLESDPKEATNQWSKQPQVVERLTALLEQYRISGRSVMR